VKSAEKDKKDREISNRYWELERKLGDKKEAELQAVNKDFLTYQEKQEKEIKDLREIVNRVNRILEFKHLTKKTLDLSFSVENGRDKSLELIDQIKTPYMTVNVYIYENDKPKNKYTLAVLGYSFFANNDDLINLPKCYGLGLMDLSANIRFAIKDNSSINELKTYYLKQKEKILGDLLKKHAYVEKEYNAVLKNYNTPEWELLYWEHQKDYYKNHYSRGTETKEYKQVLKEILNLKKGLSEIK
jgi:hypothetical protein